MGYWLKDKTMDVRQQLFDTFGGKMKVTNLAVDESQSVDVLKGMAPSVIYVKARRAEAMSAYPIDDTGKVCPLDIIKRMVKDKELEIPADSALQIQPTVVLSVGGNDMRVHLLRGARIALSSDQSRN